MTKTITEYLQGKESTIINNERVFCYNRQENVNRGSRTVNFDKTNCEARYTFAQSGFFQLNSKISNVGYVSSTGQSFWGTLYAYLYLYDENDVLIKELMSLHNYGSDDKNTTETFFAKEGYYLLAKVTSSSTNAAWGADDSFWDCIMVGYAFND